MDTELVSGLYAVLPEILLAILGFTVLTADFFVADAHRRRLGWLSVFGLVLVLAVVIWQTIPLLAPDAQPETALGGMVTIDLTTQIFRAIFLLGATLTCLISIDFRPLRQGGEYYALIIFATLGMNLMAAASNVVMLYVALETTSISLYLLAGYLRESPRSSEAGVKYFLFGAFTSTILLFGLSLLYGFTGHTGYEGMLQSLEALGPAATVPALVALSLILVGFGFKVSAVPFHMWTPDVYEGAPTPITAFVSVASKAAGFAVLVRVLMVVFAPAGEVWVSLIAALSVLTMTVGNVLAIPQKNIKRMLAYSSIAQAGYMLIGVAAAGVSSASGADALGVASVLFYLFVYLLTNIAAFIVVEVVTNALGTENIYDMAGLSRRSFGLAFAMMLAMLSLGGVPPLAGFFAKFYVFQAAMSANLVGLAVIGVLNSIVALYYYLIVIKVMFVDRREGDETPIKVSGTLGAGLALCTVAILALGILVAPWYDLAAQAAVMFTQGL